MRSNFPIVPRVNLLNFTATGDNDNQLLTLGETMMDSLRSPILMTEDRICNREELDSLGLFSFVFCIICQEVIMPEAKVPVYCTMC